MFVLEQPERYVGGLRSRLVLLCSIALLLIARPLAAQAPKPPDVADQIKTLTEAMSRAQAQLEESQRQLEIMRLQLNALQLQMAGHATPSADTQDGHAAAPPSPTAADLQAIREQMGVDEAEIATHEQAKVESSSKYPVKITGLLLFNGFVNTKGVDMAATPTLAVPGGGTTGATVRQTILGFDAIGPHVFRARSYADLRVDFSGVSQSAANTSTTYAGPYAGDALLRLRVAHAGLVWHSTEAYFALDRTIMNPDAPTSLTAVAEPALSWSGDLWTWNPQVVLKQDIRYKPDQSLRLQLGLIDVGDAPLTLVSVNSVVDSSAKSSEQSRWPGVEGRIAIYGNSLDINANHIGVGGYFSPHISLGYHFDSWAATLDVQRHLPAQLLFTGNVYRGAALGGLGGGGYKDYVVNQNSISGKFHYRTLDDIGGWIQLKETFNQRWQANAAFGMDSLFSRELSRYYIEGGSYTQNLARNTTFTDNIIFSPSAHLLLTIEYRHLYSAPIYGEAARSNVIGLGAGYKF